MNFIKEIAICNILGIHYDKIHIKDDVCCLLIHNEVYHEEDTIYNTPKGRDLLHRAWLTQAGFTVDKYYKAMANSLEFISLVKRLNQIAEANGMKPSDIRILVAYDS